MWHVGGCESLQCGVLFKHELPLFEMMFKLTYDPPPRRRRNIYIVLVVKQTQNICPWFIYQLKAHVNEIELIHIHDSYNIQETMMSNIMWFHHPLIISRLSFSAFNSEILWHTSYSRQSNITQVTQVALI